MYYCRTKRDLKKKYIQLKQKFDEVLQIRAALENSDTEFYSQVLHAYSTIVSVFNFNLIGTVYTDNTGKILDSNACAAQMLGVTDIKTLKRQAISELELTDISENDFREYYTTLNTSDAAVSFSSRIKHRDGNVLWLEFVGQKMDIISPDRRYISGIIWMLYDLTGHKQIEDSLMSANDELRRYFNNNIFGLVTIRENRVINANKRFAEIFGYDSVEELLGTDVDNLYYSQDTYADFQRKKSDAVANNKPLDIEHMFRHKNGSKIWCKCCGQFIGDAVGFRDFLWIIVDITSHKKAEAELIEANLELESFFNNDIAGIFIAQQGRVVKTNERFARMFRYDSIEDILGVEIAVLHLTPQRYDEFTRKMFEALKNGNNILLEYRFKCKDGSLIWCQCHGQALDVSDLLKGFFWIIEDITQRKEAEEKLLTANRELESYFNNDIAGIFISRNGYIIKSNTRFAEILKYESVSDLIGMEIGNLHLTSESYSEFNRKMLGMIKNRGKILIEYEFVCADGTVIWCQCQGQPIDSGELQKGFFWIIEDITTRKQAEEKLFLYATTDELSKTNNRRNFLNLVSHELARHERSKLPVSFLMLDIDKFKLINDSYGHTVGDKSITHFAAACKSSIRNSDILGRLGGDEFCVLLPETGYNDSLEVAERIVKAIRGIRMADTPNFPGLSTSIGITTITECHEIDIDHYIAQADKALYMAKSAGRNCIRSIH